MAVLASAWSNISFCFMEPILAQRLKEFDLTSTQSGNFFAIFSISYIVACMLVGWLPTRFNRFILISSAALTGAAMFLAGPSELLFLPNSVVLMAAGQVLAGVVSVTLYVPSLPEMIESVEPLFDSNGK
mmetsp:Transcript_29578/g.39338  ORF Transcript_29578/g.39338 Transcript_29578/m.39338 type:complete len:129 (-) Transcript_29578:271-657(-)|eukprot:CAMPEP_0185607682 /NCGR_PEP_ID=MMETSP0436-20130131/5688_1 /TAXON_ID=626734 ORGANISM="Favella taraikaensis, Strain Fe Narragansett Bay" /NCGR_SAMPLE_ID=MMETSP0436 /ASSEMBLY_ACC=CAM_ASM_000390 /LENGTH=128 /DNA_ID=CAMNT_0028239701 /DNA_START=543 /DNA_END=929 /DNA_ORIENTATION=+